MAADFGSRGLWNRSGSAWTQLTSWDPGAALSGWSGGLAVNFLGHGLQGNRIKKHLHRLFTNELCDTVKVICAL